MIKHVSVYASGIKIKDGPVNHYRPGEGYTYLESNTKTTNDYYYAVDTALLVPKESFSLTMASDVFIHTLTVDEDGTFYNLGQSILTDRLISAKVRQFLTGPVFSLDKKTTTIGFVLLDLEF